MQLMDWKMLCLTRLKVKTCLNIIVLIFDVCHRIYLIVIFEDFLIITNIGSNSFVKSSTSRTEDIFHPCQKTSSSFLQIYISRFSISTDHPCSSLYQQKSCANIWLHRREILNKSKPNGVNIVGSGFTVFI